MELNDKIKTLRNENNYTLEDLAKIIGVSPSTILRWESGEIKNLRRDKIKKLADALHTSPAYLMGWEDIALSVINDNKAILSLNVSDEERDVEALRPLFDKLGLSLSTKTDFDDNGKIKNVSFSLQNSDYFYNFSYNELKALKENIFAYSKFQVNELLSNAENKTKK